MGENDRAISLLERMIHHAETTAQFNVYYGEGRDRYDVREAGLYTSPFLMSMTAIIAVRVRSRGIRRFRRGPGGLALDCDGLCRIARICGTLCQMTRSISTAVGMRLMIGCSKPRVQQQIIISTSITSADGIPFWDAGAPGLIEGYGDKISDPYNGDEPVDSSAAAIAAQGLYRLGKYLDDARYQQAALTVAHTLFDAPYLSEDEEHQGLILHSIYHNPNGWDYVPDGAKGRMRRVFNVGRLSRDGIGGFAPAGDG